MTDFDDAGKDQESVNIQGEYESIHKWEDVYLKVCKDNLYKGPGHCCISYKGVIYKSENNEQPVQKSCGEAWIEYSEKARMDNWSVYEDHAQIIQDAFDAGYNAKAPERESSNVVAALKALTEYVREQATQNNLDWGLLAKNQVLINAMKALDQRRNDPSVKRRKTDYRKGEKYWMVYEGDEVLSSWCTEAEAKYASDYLNARFSEMPI